MQQEPMISVRNVLWDIDDIFMEAGEVDVQDSLEMLHDSLMKIMGQAYIDILVSFPAFTAYQKAPLGLRTSC